MESTPLNLALLSLATWRVTTFFYQESGPLDVVAKFVELSKDWPIVGAALDCFYCLSLWVAIAPAVLLADSVTAFFVDWLSLSAISILIHCWVNVATNQATSNEAE
jgi:hypothetical protein